MKKYKILIADSISKNGINILKNIENFHVDKKIGLNEDQLIDIISDYEAVIVRSGVKITAPIIKKASKLKAIGRAGVGVDNIDIKTATENGIVVMNTPAGNTISTAEHAFTLMTSLARNIPQAHNSVIEGRFKEGRKAYKGVEIYKKTLAILGMGRIGSEFAKRALGFDMNVVVYDPYLSSSKAEAIGVTLCKTVEEAIVQADFITLHMPKTPETTHIINSDNISKMKKGVRIINCARGGLIDEKAIIKGINENIIAGVALDVFENEPPSKDYELLKSKNVVFTPHLGASTSEAQENVGIEISRSIRDCILNGTVINAINMPNLDEVTIKKINPYLLLAEKLGKLASQLAPNHSDTFQITYKGNISNIDTTLITRSSLKGYLEQKSSHGSVNYLNSPSIVQNLGIKIIDTKSSNNSQFNDLIEIEVKNKDENLTLSGTIFGSKYRLVKLMNNSIDCNLEGDLLIFKNTDNPGIVGSIGKVLGNHNINIASMNLSRNREGGEAISILSLDCPATKESISEILKIEGIQSVIPAKI